MKVVSDNSQVINTNMGIIMVVDMFNCLTHHDSLTNGICLQILSFMAWLQERKSRLSTSSAAALMYDQSDGGTAGTSSVHR